MRHDFPDRVKFALAKRVAFRCSNPECRALTVGPNSNPAKATMVGVAGHITGASPGGPRYDPTLTEEERVHPDNGLWLCQTCGKRIDDDPATYPVTLLRRWKADAEAAAWVELGKTAPPGSFSSKEVLAALSAHIPDDDVGLVLGEGLRRLSSILPDKQLVVHTEGENIVVRIVDQEASGEPVVIRLSPSFPDTPDGAHRRKQFEDFVKYGSPVDLMPSDLPLDDLPTELMSLISQNPAATLRLGSKRSSRPMILALRVESETESYEIPYLDFRVTAGGTERVSLDNSEQPIPLKVWLVLTPSGKADITWSFDMSGVPVYWLREFLRFQQVAMTASRIVLRSLDDGLFSTASFDGRKSSGIQFDPNLLGIADRLVFIQEKTGVAIRLPVPPRIDTGDVAKMDWFEHVLLSGRQPSPPKVFRLHIEPADDISDVVQQLERTPFTFRMPSHREELLGNSIELGPVVVTCPSIELVPVTEEVKEGPNLFEYVVLPRETFSLDVVYERFLTQPSGL